MCGAGRPRSRPPEKVAEGNGPGAYGSVTDRAGGETTEGILWGLSREPLTVRTGDVYYTIGLTRKSYRAPFVVRVDEVRHEVHAGTTMAASYESDVTRIDGDSEEKIRIWMNHPLRHAGFTFFQTTMGTTSDGRQYTGFEVVRNPADQGPLVACVIISIGLLVQFLQKLGGYMRTEARRRTA